MSKLAEIERELAEIIKKHEIDKLVNRPAIDIARSTTTVWGCFKSICKSDELNKEAGGNG